MTFFADDDFESLIALRLHDDFLIPRPEILEQPKNQFLVKNAG